MKYSTLYIKANANVPPRTEAHERALTKKEKRRRKDKVDELP